MHKGTSLAATVAGFVLAMFSGTLLAQQPQPFDVGRIEYESNCAVCHGLEGKGDGPYRPFLTKTPANLTGLAKANGGVFPVQRMYELIDGRLEVAAHGPREMPIWGNEYRAQAATQPGITYQPEAYVRARIIALIEYLNRLQVRSL